MATPDAARTVGDAAQSDTDTTDGREHAAPVPPRDADGTARSTDPASHPPDRGPSDGASSLTIDDVLLPSDRRDVRRLPALIAQAFRLVYRAAPRELLTAGGLQLLAGLSVAAQLLVLRRVLDGVMATGTPNLGALAPDLIAFAALLLLVAVAGLAQGEQQRTLGELVEKYTTGHVMDVATSVDLIAFDEPVFYDRLQRARVNASARPLQIANGVIGLLGSGAAVVAVGATLLWIEPFVAALILVGGLPAVVINRLSSRAFHAYMVRQTPGDRRRSYLYMILSRKEEAQEVRAFDSSDYLRREHDRIYDEKIVDLRRTVRYRLLLGLVSAAITSLVTVGALVLLLAFVRTGRLELADAAVAVGAVVIVAGRIRGLVGASGSLYEGALFLRDFTGFLAVGEHERAKRAASAPPPPPFSTLELDRVSFTYPSRDEPSLQDVSLTLRQGEVIALVGENGSGKTTLTKLLAGLYRPTDGAVRWDGTDVGDVDLAHLREHVTVIFQDFARYYLTAQENVAIGRIEDHDDLAAVRAAAAKAGADGFLAELARGYGSLLGPSFAGGVDLSGGQWQRVALARAYFRDAPVLILDEPTASLDPRGEYEIFQRVRRLAEGHTVVLVSHRFSSVRAADRIVVLDEGRIVDQGSHDELLARGGLYAELYDLQAQGYRDTHGQDRS
jgi:ATP-binding cassette subfamily B protein